MCISQEEHYNDFPQANKLRMIVKISRKHQRKRNRVYNFKTDRAYEKKTRNSIKKKVRKQKKKT